MTIKTMEYSIIQKSQLEGAKRLDAEYYQPEYFIDFSKGQWVPIGTCLKTCQYGLSEAMNDQRKGYPMFKMDNIFDGFLIDEEVRYAEISEEEHRQCKLVPNDVLFNRVNSEEFVGRTGIYKITGLDSVFASYLIRLQVDPEGEVLADYLNIFLNCNFGTRQIRKYARRAVNQANVNAEELKQMKIALFPISEQEKVAGLSNKAWHEFENAKTLYSQAENILLGELGLEDFKAEEDLYSIVNFSDIKSANRMDAEYYQPKYERAISVVRKHGGTTLGELVSVEKGFEPGADAYEDEGKLFIRVSSISKHELLEKDQKYISKKLYEELKKEYEPKKGEILLTKDASPGVAYALDTNVEGIISSGILRLKLKEEINPDYLALCINSVVGQMQVERDAGGSVIAHWKPEQVKNMLVPILSKSIQDKIAELVRESHAARKKAKELLEEAKSKVEELIESKAK